MRVFQLLPVYLVIASLGCSTTDSGGVLNPDVEMQLGAATEAATEAVDMLIHAGFPALQVAFSTTGNSEGFYGSCGHPPLYSAEYIDRPLTEGELTADGVFHPQEMPDEERSMFFSTVADAKLFVAVTTGRQEPSRSIFSFCKLTQDGVPVDSEIVLSRLRDLYYSTPSPGANYTPEAVNHVLRKIGIDGVS